MFGHDSTKFRDLMAWGGSHAFMHPPSTPSEAFLISQPSEAHFTDPTHLTYLALSDHLSDSLTECTRTAQTESVHLSRKCGIHAVDVAVSRRDGSG